MNELVNKVYFPPVGTKPFSFKDFAQGRAFYLYGLGRYALQDAFRIYGLKAGDRVLFPEFVCRDLLASAQSLGLEVLFYPVNENLTLKGDAASLPVAQAIVAVDYFGFPQDMTLFYQYQKKHQCLLIEDNAHGFLSKTTNGEILGLRADAGIFSLRKTIPSALGGALVLSKEPKQTVQSLDVVPGGAPRAKELMRSIGRAIHAVALIQFFTALQRFIRKLRTGYAIPPSDADAEVRIPDTKNPTEFFLQRLSFVDARDEVSRRRLLYEQVRQALAKTGVRSVFADLPEGVAPYGYAFICAPEKLPEVDEVLKGMQLEYFPWPELPHAVLQKPHPKFYEQVNLVRFLW